jgi:N-acetylmuramoyl-L-alanine amidase
MKNITILLDEGHYETCPGKRSPVLNDGRQLFEWKFTRELGKRIKEECDKLGIKCIRTTNSDNEKSLTARANSINKYVRAESELGNKSLMISLHGNAAGSGSWMQGKGWEVWTTEGTTNSDAFANLMCNIYPQIFPESLLKGKDKKFQLRGHKEKNFTLIYKCACPCVLTENFFYDNEEECKFMLSEEGLNKIVKLHVESIKEYLK